MKVLAWNILADEFIEKYKMKDSKTNQSQDMFLMGQLQYHIQ